MRLRFDPEVDGDERAAARARDELVERFRQWLEGRPAAPGVDAWDAQLLLEWKWSYVDGDYGWWVRGHIDELLLEHLPRKLSASPDEVEPLPESLAAFFTFLEEEGLLDPRGDSAEALGARARAQKRAFLDAMADPANFGMAKRLFTAGGIGLDEPPTQEALDEAMAAFNALPFEERGRILGLDGLDAAGGLGGGGPLPPPEAIALPVRPLPTDEELERAAEDVALLRRVDGLHHALGEDGIKLTKAGNPTVADGKRLAAVLGVDEGIDTIRSAAELPELFGVAQVAMRAGAVTHRNGRFVAVGRWAKQPPVDRWQRVVDAVFEVGPATLCFGAVEPAPAHLAAVADEGAVHFLAMLWLAGEPVPLEAFVETLEVASRMYPRSARIMALAPDVGRSVCESRVEDVFGSLSSAGLVHRTGDEVSLTTAAARLAVEVLEEEGFDLVGPDELRALDATLLLDLLEERGDEPGAVGAIWCVGRGAEAAAREVVAAMLADPAPTRMLVGYGVLGGIGDAAVEVVRGALDTPIGPMGWLFLTDHDAVDPETVPREAVVRAGVHTMLALSELGSPADLVESLLGGIPIEDHAGLIDDMATSDDPAVGDLLETLGRHHPHKPVAKHARKAAHRWRSRRGSVAR